MGSYSDIAISGWEAFASQAILAGAGYCAATWLARRTPSPPREIYIARLGLMAAFLGCWWFLYAPFCCRAVGGNELLIGFWCAVARQAGRYYGLHTIWAWCAIAVIDWPGKPRYLASGGGARVFALSFLILIVSECRTTGSNEPPADRSVYPEVGQ